MQNIKNQNFKQSVLNVHVHFKICWCKSQTQSSILYSKPYNIMLWEMVILFQRVWRYMNLLISRARGKRKKEKLNLSVKTSKISWESSISQFHHKASFKLFLSIFNFHMYGICTRSFYTSVIVILSLLHLILRGDPSSYSSLISHLLLLHYHRLW